MRRAISLMILPALALTLTACSESNPFPRADFPSTPGFYVQAYKDGHNTIAELAKVEAGGKVTSTRSTSWLAKPVDMNIVNETAMFDECGVALTFRPGQNGKMMTTPMVTSHASKRSCPLGDLPVLWTIVKASEG